MMRSRGWSVLTLAALAVGNAVVALPALAQEERKPEPKRTLEMQGRIVQTAPEQFIVETRDKKQIKFAINPQTKYVMNSKPAQFTDLRVGANLTIVYVQEGDRYIANTITLVPADAVPPVEGTLVEGEVVRVVGEDQVVLRVSGGKEVIVFVDPKTTYLFENKPGRFTDLRPGVSISAYYNERDRRNMAHRIIGPRRRDR